MSFSWFRPHYDSSSSVEHFLTMMLFDSDSLSSVEHLLTMMPFDLSSSLTQLYDKVPLSGKSFNLLLSVEKTCKVGICFEEVISVLTG